MTEIFQSVASLIFVGEDLIPEDVTRLISKSPTRSQTKGKNIEYPKRDEIRIAKYGNWILQCEYCSPADLNEQITSLLENTTDDMKKWQELSKKYQDRVFCGLWLKEENERLSISADILEKLGKRNLEIDFDIYTSPPD